PRAAFLPPPRFAPTPALGLGLSLRDGTRRLRASVQEGPQPGLVQPGHTERHGLVVLGARVVARHDEVGLLRHPGRPLAAQGGPPPRPRAASPPRSPGPGYGRPARRCPPRRPRPAAGRRPPPPDGPLPGGPRPPATCPRSRHASRRRTSRSPTPRWSGPPRPRP